MNEYQYQFSADCLVDGEVITYQLTIKTHEQLFVEDIIAFEVDSPCIQETIANKFYRKFGGQQVMIGTHSGVKLTTYRGFS